MNLSAQYIALEERKELGPSTSRWRSLGHISVCVRERGSLQCTDWIESEINRVIAIN